MKKTTKRASAAPEGASTGGIGPADPRDRGQRRFLEDAEEDGELALASVFLGSRLSQPGQHNTAEGFRVGFRDGFRAWKLAQKTGVALLGLTGVDDLDPDSEAPTVAMTGSRSEPPPSRRAGRLRDTAAVGKRGRSKSR